MDKIKPFAWANKCARDGYLYGIEDGPDGEDTHAYAVEVGDEAVPLYDQSAIDALRAEVEKERRVAIELGAMLEAADRYAIRYLRLRSSLYRRNIDVGEATLCLLVTGACPSEGEFDAAIDAATQGDA